MEAFYWELFQIVTKRLILIQGRSSGPALLMIDTLLGAFDYIVQESEKKFLQGGIISPI